MSGHSKFANIKHKKEKNDAAKGKIFTIIGREIAVAVKEGGPDPANNYKLATVIAKAKANNMPNDTIERGMPSSYPLSLYRTPFANLKESAEQSAFFFAYIHFFLYLCAPIVFCTQFRMKKNYLEQRHSRIEHKFCDEKF